jgi:hypothetical protein
MCGISSATLAAALPSDTNGSQAPLAPRASSSGHAHSRDTSPGPRFAPMSANGVKRFDRHSREFAMMYAFLQISHPDTEIALAILQYLTTRSKLSKSNTPVMSKVHKSVPPIMATNIFAVVLAETSL